MTNWHSINGLKDTFGFEKLLGLRLDCAKLAQLIKIEIKQLKLKQYLKFESLNILLDKMLRE